MASRLSKSNIERKAFKGGLILKLIDGCFELGASVIVWLVHPATIDRIARFLTDDELAEDPHDFIANHVLRFAHHYSSTGARAFVALYLLAHGIVKVGLVIALLRRRRWAYPTLIVCLSLFIVYQGYRMTYRPSIGLALLTIFDGVVVWLVWRQYRRLRLAGGARPRILKSRGVTDESVV